MKTFFVILLFQFNTFFVINNDNLKNPFYIVNDCNFNTCNFPNLCFNKTICQCQKGYYDILNDTKKCNYEQKNKMIFIWLEYFFNLGIGHILSGNIIKGIIKFIIRIITLVFIYISILSNYFKKTNITCYQVLISLFTLILVFVNLILMFIDYFYMSGKNYLDKNEIPFL
jgi:hypothetical protein